MKLPTGAATITSACLFAATAVAQPVIPPAAQQPSANSAKAKTVGAEAKKKATPDALTCDDFQRNTDGTWSPTHEVAVRRSGLIVTLKPGETYGEGSTIIGLPLADMLDKQC
jgi:hypothetical protein